MRESVEKLVENLVENFDFSSYEEFKNELKRDKKEVVKYLEWRVNGGKQRTNGYIEKLPDGYVDACKQILTELHTMES